MTITSASISVHGSSSIAYNGWPSRAVSATTRSISPLARSPVCTSDAVTTGRSEASAGQSHSWVTPTTRSPSPSANSTSVAAGTSEQIRIDPAYPREAR